MTPGLDLLRGGVDGQHSCTAPVCSPEEPAEAHTQLSLCVQGAGHMEEGASHAWGAGPQRTTTAPVRLPPSRRGGSCPGGPEPIVTHILGYVLCGHWLWPQSGQWVLKPSPCSFCLHMLLSNGDSSLAFTRSGTRAAGPPHLPLCEVQWP